MRLSFKAAMLAASLASVVACSNNSASDSPSTAMSISGTMSVGARMTSTSKLSLLGYAKNQVITAIANYSGKGTGDGVSSQSAACSDGAYYRVLCTAWSTPPVANYGDVSCSGSSGGFTVTGMPMNTDISCAIRKSTDGATFQPFANLELPASSMTGTTDNINAGGDMVLAVTVSSSNGTATATVTSGTNTTPSATTTVDATAMTGFYNMTCPTDISAANTLQCKCFLFANNEKKQDCINNNAVNVTMDKMTINLGVYEGTVGGTGVDFNSDGTADAPAGAKVYAGAVWAADNGGAACTTSGSCTSARTGAGEGLPTFTNLTWTDSSAAAAITWPSTVSLTCTDGTTNANVSTGTFPTSSTDRTGWLSWYQTFVAAYDTACGSTANTNGWTGCTAGFGSRSTDSVCLGNFTWAVLENSRANLPRIRWDWQATQNCGTSGCTTNTPAPGMIQVDGIDFPGDTGAPTWYNPNPRNRFVFDQFLPNSAGTGGSLHNGEFEHRFYNCADIGTACSSAAISAGSNIECGIKTDLIIKFMPTSTTGAFNMVFNQTNSVAFGTYRGGSGVDGTDAYSACVTAMSVDNTTPAFMARATKL